MTKSKNTKIALLVSMLSMILCCAMLIGSTFAWFTDSVTSGKNKIVAGNLDVEMEYAVLNENGSFKEWKSVDSKTSLFDEKALWEPGYTQVVYLKVKNVGSLSLNYKLTVDGVDKPGKGYDKVTQSEFDINLSDFLEFGAVTTDEAKFFANRDAARAAIKENAGNIKTYSVTGSIKASEKDTDIDYITLVVYMPETVGKKANHYKTFAPEITLGIDLLATQMVDESDSFGNTYDEGAILPDVVVTTTASLIDAVKEAESGAVIQLATGTYENVGTLTVDKDLTFIGENGAIMNNAVVEIKERANVVIENVDFAGDSYIHNQGMKSFTMKGCDVDVNVPENVNNSRAAFISLGTPETTYGVKLDIQDNTFKVKSNADRYVAAINGWAYIEDGSVISGNTFGSEDSRYNFIAVKLMNFVDGAAITISDNTVYGTINDWYFYAFDLYQNNSRANKYTADFSGNTVDVTGDSSYEGYFLCLEANNGVNSATVNIGSTNTYNGQSVIEDNCDIEETAGSVNFIFVD